MNTTFFFNIGTCTHHTKTKPAGSYRTMTIQAKWDGTRLSFTGTIGRGHGGQIIIAFHEFDDRGHLGMDNINFAKGWDAPKLRHLLQLWERWHLNDMRPGCPHQMEQGWDSYVLDPDKPKVYGNMACWSTPEQHPMGILGKPCPICGYRYGSSWLTEEVPPEILIELHDLADSCTGWEPPVMPTPDHHASEVHPV